MTVSVASAEKNIVIGMTESSLQMRWDIPLPVHIIPLPIPPILYGSMYQYVWRQSRFFVTEHLALPSTLKRKWWSVRNFLVIGDVKRHELSSAKRVKMVEGVMELSTNSEVEKMEVVCSKCSVLGGGVDGSGMRSSTKEGAGRYLFVSGVFVFVNIYNSDIRRKGWWFGVGRWRSIFVFKLGKALFSSNATFLISISEYLIWWNARH